MLTRVIIFGGTGQLILIKSILEKLGYKIVAVFDANKDVINNPPFADIPFFHESELQTKLSEIQQNHECLYFVATMCYPHGSIRMKLQHYLSQLCITPINVIDNTAYIGEYVILGAGAQILANANIMEMSVIGDQFIANVGSIVHHECKIGNGVEVGPGATICGLVEIGDFSKIGANATVLPRIKIGKRCLIGAGSVVTKNVPDNSIVYGVPAKLKGNTNDNNE